MRNEDRECAIVEITSRIVSRYMEESTRSKGMPVLQVVNDTMYQEFLRLKQDRNGHMYQEDYAFWKEIQRKLPQSTEREIKKLLTNIVTRFSREVAGNFSPQVYDLSVKVLPVGLSLLLNSVSPTKLLRQFPNMPTLEHNVQLSGNVKQLQELEKRGTVVLLPTHLSNLDSPIVGWSIYHMGLPPFTYGAGLNLFSNPMLSFFMRNLGAYRVDRRKKAPIYKDVLKEYATCSLEYGYNNIFFPGGTRSRSGIVERRIKKGLLGTAINSYVHNLQNKKKNPKIFIVPCTLNYHLVLEAKSLIEDYLKSEGRSRYIVANDEFSDIKRIVKFVTNLIKLDSQIQVVIGEAFDPFGNRVDIEGQSYDSRERPVDISKYVLCGGKPAIDPQRDHEYTNELSKVVSEQFSNYNMLMVTHLVAAACFLLLREKNPDMDLYRLLHTGGNIDHLALSEVCEMTDRLYNHFKTLEQNGKIRLEPWLHTQNSEGMVERALRFFKSYHAPSVIRRRGDRIIPGDMNLLYYYQNRLKGYPLPEG
ncbi:MAG: acyltransferase [Deltaproteobacteria bacterium]|nr:acyltransferase [Deltaproteobacteria bacterium]|tara:strand:+ start:1954 stop:3546 length:1593 start_codon:yes stop_codon:yes gene_type:complete